MVFLAGKVGRLHCYIGSFIFLSEGKPALKDVLYLLRVVINLRGLLKIWDV